MPECDCAVGSLYCDMSVLNVEMCLWPPEEVLHVFCVGTASCMAMVLGQGSVPCTLA